MSAQRDKKSPIQFHYSNALLDFDHLLPREDESKETSLIDQQLNLLEKRVAGLETINDEITFLVEDISSYFY